MRNILTLIAIVAFSLLVSYSTWTFASAVEIPGGNIIQAPSITITPTSWDGITILQDFGFKILAFLKLFVSGIALLYLVLIGAYMIVYSENEEKIKTQRKQIIYALMGFLFLNIPGTIYTVFLPSDKSGWQLDMTTSFNDISSTSLFWDTYGFDWVIGSLVAFFRVFIFAVAVVMFTWWLFRLLVSAGDDEARKQGKNRIIYGILALLFLGFVEGWSGLVADADFEDYIPYIGGKLFGIAIFFAAPVAIFFLIWWAYYYITSAGDEERVKKWKTIIINTFIATLILIASLSFITDLINFQL